MEERDDMAVLIDEDGQEHRFLVVEIFPVKDLEYAILVPLGVKENDNGQAGAEEDDAYIFRIKEVDGEHYFEEVGDEEEWNLVAEEWENLIRAREAKEDEPGE